MSLGPNFKLGSLLLVAAFVIFTAALYGGAQIVKVDKPEEAAAQGPSEIPTGPVTVNLVAKNIQFDKDEIVAGVGSEVTIIFDNQDAGVLHNVAFYTSSSATQEIFVGEITTGVITIEESFTAPAVPGDYFFRCDVHPDTMRGTFIVG